MEAVLCVLSTALATVTATAPAESTSDRVPGDDCANVSGCRLHMDNETSTSQSSWPAYFPHKSVDWEIPICTYTFPESGCCIAQSDQTGSRFTSETVSICGHIRQQSYSSWGYIGLTDYVILQIFRLRSGLILMGGHRLRDSLRRPLHLYLW